VGVTLEEFYSILAPDLAVEACEAADTIRFEIYKLHLARDLIGDHLLLMSSSACRW
jgi:hypothetical protein